MEVDIVCVGFGPATAGLLTTLAKAPELPLQVLCYERADDIGFGVSGVVTRARGIRASLPELDLAQIPMAAPVTEEKVVYLTPHSGFELPYIPPFLRKHDGMILSIGQFLQHVGGELMAGGAVQIWPGTPVEEAIVENGAVRGVRLTGQEIDVLAKLTVVGDGPVGAVGRQLSALVGEGVCEKPCEWAVGMKMVVELHEHCELKPGTVIHTFGYPEPEIFGFLYVHPGNVASVGIFVPSWMQDPAHSPYRYLQYFMLHPYIWQHLEGGRLRSWGAKTLNESGRRAEPLLTGAGWARIGEGSGSTNVLSGSGVDEAWTTGVQLGEGILELLQAGKPLTKENLDAAYVARRRASWVEQEARVAEHSRDGFLHGMIPGLLGMALAGFTGGRLSMPVKPNSAQEFVRPKREWPEIPYDGQLLVSHQDALLMGGKVQAPGGFADHVRFLDPEACAHCVDHRCIQMCSAQAIAAGEGAVPAFDREKCIHCGACLWNCRRGAIAFEPGGGGLHSNEN